MSDSINRGLIVTEYFMNLVVDVFGRDRDSQ